MTRRWSRQRPTTWLPRENLGRRRGPVGLDRRLLDISRYPSRQFHHFAGPHSTGGRFCLEVVDNMKGLADRRRQTLTWRGRGRPFRRAPRRPPARSSSVGQPRQQRDQILARSTSHRHPRLAGRLLRSLRGRRQWRGNRHRRPFQAIPKNFSQLDIGNTRSTTGTGLGREHRQGAGRGARRDDWRQEQARPQPLLVYLAAGVAHQVLTSNEPRQISRNSA